MTLQQIAQEMLAAAKPGSYPVTRTLERGLILRLERGAAMLSLTISRAHARPSDIEMALIQQHFAIPRTATGLMTWHWPANPQATLPEPETDHTLTELSQLIVCQRGTEDHHNKTTEEVRA